MPLMTFYYVACTKNCHVSSCKRAISLNSSFVRCTRCLNMFGSSSGNTSLCTPGRRLLANSHSGTRQERD